MPALPFPHYTLTEAADRLLIKDQDGNVVGSYLPEERTRAMLHAKSPQLLTNLEWAVQKLEEHGLRIPYDTAMIKATAECKDLCESIRPRPPSSASRQ